jgi:integrase
MSAASNYRSIAVHHLVPALGRKRVEALTPSDVDRLMSEKLDAGYSASSVRRMRSVLLQALNQGMHWGVVHRNVAALTRGPRVARREGRTLTPGQANRGKVKALEESAARTHLATMRLLMRG